LDKIYSEKFIIIFLEKKYIFIESDKLIFLLENLNNSNSNFNANSYFINNSFIIEIDSDLNTNNFIIFEDNQPENKNDFYHFFLINYPKNIDKDITYLSEIYRKSNLKNYFILNSNN